LDYRISIGLKHGDRAANSCRTLPPGGQCRRPTSGMRYGVKPAAAMASGPWSTIPRDSGFRPSTSDSREGLTLATPIAGDVTAVVSREEVRLHVRGQHRRCRLGTIPVPQPLEVSKPRCQVSTATRGNVR
jgi:hypothetical protein